MKKKIKAESYHFGGHNGAIGSGETFKLETDKYIIPKTVRIKMNGREIYPTSFDEHGNPRIDGIAGLIFIWNKRRMVMDGLIENQYSDLEVECKYDITTQYFEVPISDRIIKMDTCPMCGKKFKVTELQNELESYDNVLFHKSCLKEFKKMQMIDEIANKVQYGLSYKFDTLNWSKDITYKLIPNEYCSGGCCSHRPWFLFDTPYGKIKIGWRKRVISISFLEGSKR